MSHPASDLAGRTALVTGAARGISAAIAGRLAERGARVVIADLLAEEGRETAAALTARGLEASFTPLDASDEWSWTRPCPARCARPAPSTSWSTTPGSR